MSVYRKHLDFFDHVWGLNARTLNVFRDAANANTSEREQGYVARRLEELHKAGAEDHSCLVQEVVDMGPSIHTLMLLSIYIGYTQPRVLVPKSSSKALADDRSIASDAPVQDASVEDATAPDEDKLEAHEAAAAADNGDGTAAGGAYFLIDGTVVDVGMVTLWILDFSKSELTNFHLVRPHLVFVPVATHNEIILMHGAAEGLVRGGFLGFEVLEVSVHTVGKFAEKADEQGETAEQTEVINQHTQANQAPSGPYITSRMLLQNVCFRLDLADPNFWHPESPLNSIIMTTFRLCFVMATGIDDKYYFADGRLQVGMTKIATELLNSTYGMLLTECVDFMAYSMITHQVQRSLIRGRLVSAFDLYAMIPASRAIAETGPSDTAAACDLVDNRPRGRVHASCFHRSTRGSNLIVDADAYRVRVVVASLLLAVGGVLVSRHANARFTFN